MSGWHTIDEQRTGVNVTKRGRMDEHRRQRTIVQPDAVRFAAQRDAHADLLASFEYGFGCGRVTLLGERGQAKAVGGAWLFGGKYIDGRIFDGKQLADTL